MLVCTYACTWYGEGVHWPLSDGLFPPKWRHKGSGVGNGVGLCVYVYVCVCALKKRGRGFLECVEMSFALPSNYVLLFHLPLLSSSPIPHPFSSFFSLSSHSAAAPSWATGGSNLCLSCCSDCIHTEVRAGGLLPNNTGLPLRQHSHTYMHMPAGTAQTQRPVCLFFWKECSGTYCLKVQ